MIDSLSFVIKCNNCRTVIFSTTLIFVQTNCQVRTRIRSHLRVSFQPFLQCKIPDKKNPSLFLKDDFLLFTSDTVAVRKNSTSTSTLYRYILKNVTWHCLRSIMKGWQIRFSAISPVNPIPSPERQ